MSDYISKLGERKTQLRDRDIELRNIIDKTNTLLERNKFEDMLVDIGLYKPLLVPATKKYKEYMHITSPVYLQSCEITFYPVWIELEAVYPPWSKSIRNLFIESLHYYDDEEIVVDAISRSMGIGYKEASKYLPIECDTIYSSTIYEDIIEVNYEDFHQIKYDDPYFDSKYFSGYPHSLIDTPYLNHITVNIKHLLIVPTTYL